MRNSVCAGRVRNHLNPVGFVIALGCHRECNVWPLNYEDIFGSRRPRFERVCGAKDEDAVFVNLGVVELDIVGSVIRCSRAR